MKHMSTRSENMTTILIIEDDKDLSYITADMLKSYGYQVECVEDAAAAYALLMNHRFDLIILDINLPDESGFEVCIELSKISNVPLIFVIARTNEDDKIAGLDIGGDDYLAKPYSLKELLSRINALIRRSYGNIGNQAEYRIGTKENIHVNQGMRTVTRDGNEVRLALKEFDLLVFLCQNQNLVLSKEALLHEVWGVLSEVEIATVAVHIRWLREKLEEDPANPQFIKTVWGVGYRLVK